MAIEYVDSPPPGWFVLDVMRTQKRVWNWSALMVDYDPDDPNVRPCDLKECWFRIPGKHKDRDTAWGALEDLMATRH